MPVEILIGDVLDRLRGLPDESVDCVVTSPPYWGLRDYGVEGQIGLEATLGEHMAVMVKVFDEIWRVLKKAGTVWVNYGDCYASAPNGRSAADVKAKGNDNRTFRDKPFSTVGGVLKPKDLCMLPNRLAIALQEAGWWVRSEIIWHKPNPMPESVKDRPVSSHEKLFLLSKSQKYFYDAGAVREAAAGVHLRDGFRGANDGPSGYVHQAYVASNSEKGAKRGSFKRENSKRGVAHVGQSMGTHRPDRPDVDYCAEGVGRAQRNVWTIATHAFADAHFATFPPALVEPCIKAGCPDGGVVLDPFGGAGTVGLVADRLGRHAILIELNPDYAEIARKRILDDAGMFAVVQVACGRQAS